MPQDLPITPDSPESHLEWPVDSREEKFFDGAFRRITFAMLVMTAVLAPFSYVYFGRRAAASFVFGCILSLFNFAALRKTVSGIADRVIGTGEGQSGRVMVLRFLLRYGLVAGAFYAIFRGSALNVYALTAGLSLPVAAIFIETGYEIIHAMRT